MNSNEKRRYPRQRVDLSVVVSRPDPRPAPPTTVVDLSEGGARVQWTLPDDVAINDRVRLRFLLAADQSIELDARVVRIDDGHAGLEFAAAQHNLVRQLLAETCSTD